jgi:hypothetical protein
MERYPLSWVASVHLADVGLRGPRLLLRTPRRDRVPGLLGASVGTGASLSASLLPRPHLGRAALVAFWEGDDAIDRFLDDSAYAAAFSSGWHARLEPVRMFGRWPGLPEGEVSVRRSAQHDGPAVVVTLGRVRWVRALPFLRASAHAAAALAGSPGLLWATGIARPPFVCTLSLWRDAESVRRYAYGSNGEGAHVDAIHADRTKPFHRHSAFIRFRPYDLVGSLAGTNPLPVGALQFS